MKGHKRKCICEKEGKYKKKNEERIQKKNKIEIISLSAKSNHRQHNNEPNAKLSECVHGNDDDDDEEEDETNKIK